MNLEPAVAQSVKFVTIYSTVGIAFSRTHFWENVNIFLKKLTFFQNDRSQRPEGVRRRAAHRWKAGIELFPNYKKYFLKLLLGSQKKGKKRWSLKFWGSKNHDFVGFFKITFFWESFFKIRIPVFCRASIHVVRNHFRVSRAPGSQLPKRLKTKFSSKISTFPKISEI